MLLPWELFWIFRYGNNIICQPVGLRNFSNFVTLSFKITYNKQKKLMLKNIFFLKYKQFHFLPWYNLNCCNFSICKYKLCKQNVLMNKFGLKRFVNHTVQFISIEHGRPKEYSHWGYLGISIHSLSSLRCLRLNYWHW